MTIIITFISWTFVIYWCHRLAHHLPLLKNLHKDHHQQISENTYKGLHWSNLFLYFDSLKSTADQWFTEVIPTLLFSYVTGQWWLFVAYYIWAALIQEAIEHNPKFNWYPFITSGKWHLVHHDDNSKNFGVFIPVWDKIFGTWQPIKTG